ncbi:MAG: hypothetical protein Kow00107_00490 [Planctomycetota bacterium]
MRRSALALLLFLLPFACATGEQPTSYDQYVSRFAELRAFRASKWKSLGELSWKLGLHDFARLDDEQARKLGAQVEPRKYEAGAQPLYSTPAFQAWEKARLEMLEEFSEKGESLLEWAQENYPAGVRSMASEILAELPRHKEANEALGRIYSDVLGWVDGDDAKNVAQGLLPFGKGWLPRAEVEKLRSDWANAWEISEGGFIVRTNTTPELARKILEFLEAYRQAYLLRFSNFGLSPKKQGLYLNIFSDRRTFAEIANRLSPGAENAGAFYFDRTGQTYMVADAGSNGYIFSPGLVAHEHSHQFLHQYLQITCDKYYDKPGAWINEALASYCETAKKFADRVAFTGWERNYHFSTARALNRDGRLMDLEEFVVATGDVFRKPGDGGIFYSQGMALFSFWLHAKDGKYVKPFFKYVSEIVKGRGDKRLFKRCFGVSPSEMDAEFREWLSSFDPV